MVTLRQIRSQTRGCEWTTRTPHWAEQPIQAGTSSIAVYARCTQCDV